MPAPGVYLGRWPRFASALWTLTWEKLCPPQLPVHPSHLSVTQFLSHSPLNPIYLTRWAYLPGTTVPDTKSFVQNILPISSLKPKILVLSHL